MHAVAQAPIHATGLLVESKRKSSKHCHSYHLLLRSVTKQDK